MSKNKINNDNSIEINTINNIIVNPCVICGAETPEGSLVCGTCMREAELLGE